MISFSGCIIQANGEIEYNKSFRIRASKASTFDGDEKLLNGFLRTKMKNKGYHGSWKRYGSWTFYEDDTDAPSYLYAWGYSKGKQVHSHDYVMKTEPIKLFDDLFLMRLKTASLQVQLSDTLPISSDILTEWFKCIRTSKKTVAETTDESSGKKSNGKHSHSEDAIFEIDDDELMNGGAQKLMKIEIPNDNESDNEDNNSDEELPSVQDATIDGSDKEVSDDDDDVSDMEDDALFDDDMDDDDADMGVPEDDDDEDDDGEDTIQIGENQMLQYEPYEYDEADNISCELPQYISPWV